jgi:hypothetical protein
VAFPLSAWPEIRRASHVVIRLPVRRGPGSVRGGVGPVRLGVAAVMLRLRAMRPRFVAAGGGLGAGRDQLGAVDGARVPITTGEVAIDRGAGTVTRGVLGAEVAPPITLVRRDVPSPRRDVPVARGDVPGYRTVEDGADLVVVFGARSVTLVRQPVTLVGLPGSAVQPELAVVHRRFAASLPESVSICGPIVSGNLEGVTVIRGRVRPGCP